MKSVAGRCVFSIDVEDWFHILDLASAPRLYEWNNLPSRVETNFVRLLDLSGQHGVRCTCFFVGWVAQRFPHLVKVALERGHEIASHGWAHRLAYELTPKEFYEDAARAKEVLEQISGRRVLGYRCAGFSVSKDNAWLFDELIRAGYVYDASVFPGPRAHGGWRNGRYFPYLVCRPDGSLVEFPMTIKKVLGWPFCFFGGGYLRLFPLSLIIRMTARVLDQGRPAIFYVHPREIDPAHPRLLMSPWRRFKSYTNVETTAVKLHQLLDAFEFATFEELVPKPPHVGRTADLRLLEPVARI